MSNKSSSNTSQPLLLFSQKEVLHKCITTALPIALVTRAELSLEFYPAARRQRLSSTGGRHRRQRAKQADKSLLDAEVSNENLIRHS